MADTIMMTVAGPAIKLARDDGKYSLVFPMTQDMSVSSTQKVFAPMKELVTFIQSSVASVAPGAGGGNLINTAINLTTELQKLLGLQINAKGFYALAWNGSEPSQTALKLKFIRGMNGNWAPHPSVIEPANTLYGLTLPDDSWSNGISILTPPMPSAVGVVSTYASQLVGAFIPNGIPDIPGVGSVKTTITNGIKGFADGAGFGKRVWAISYGYYNGSQEFIPYLSLPSAIIASSSITYSKEMCLAETLTGSQIRLPNSAEVSLNFNFQNIFTMSDFLKTEKQVSWQADTREQQKPSPVSVDAIAGADIDTNVVLQRTNR